MQSHFESSYDHSADLSASINVEDAKILDCNQDLVNTTGFSRSDLIGRPIFSLHPPDDKQAVESALKNVLARYTEIEIELNLIANNGSHIPAILFMRKVENSKGQSLYIACSWRTPNSSASHTLEQTPYSFFFDNNLDMCALANSEGYFKLVNKKFSEVLGFTKEEIYSQSFLELIHPDDIASTLAVYQKAIEGESLFNFVNRYRKKDGSYIFMDWNCSTNTETGDIYCIARDISDRIMVEEQLKTVNKELEAFSYSVAHDLRAPLRAILGFSQILIEDFSTGLDNKALHFLRRIHANSAAMGALIDDLLDFSRLGRKQVLKSTVDMHKLTEHILSENSDNVSPQTTITLGALHTVYGDAGLLAHVVQNLLGNAIKYSATSPKPRIEITSERNDTETIFSVADNGVGFDMQYANKLFEVFQRLHSSKDFSGTGIGLALAHRIIEKHGGRMWAEGAVNQGAKFYFALPLKTTEPHT